jgi:hypothetical protein
MVVSMKAYLFLAILVMTILIAGCAKHAAELQATDADAGQQAQPAASVQNATPQQASPASDCALLTAEEIASNTGIKVLAESRFFNYSLRNCARRWISADDESASITLTVWRQAESENKGELLTCELRDSYQPIRHLGDYSACWYPSANAINFGKGEYKFQIQCAGEICTQADALELAKLVLGKV